MNFDFETLTMKNNKYCKTIMDVGQFLNLLSNIAAWLRCFHSSAALYKQHCLTETLSNSIRVNKSKSHKNETLSNLSRRSCISN